MGWVIVRCGFLCSLILHEELTGCRRKGFDLDVSSGEAWISETIGREREGVCLVGELIGLWKKREGKGKGRRDEVS